MDFNRKICIVFIIIIFIYILTRLFQKRFSIEQQYELNTIEGYENITVNGIQNGNSCPINIQDNLIVRLMNVTTLTSVNISSALSLRNYAVKGSMNSAFDGKICSTDMINYVLSRGCRLIDLEVYRDPVSTSTIVSVSTDNDFTTPIIQEYPLTISDAIKQISQIGFNGYCPNNSDPLFIQFRPRIPTTDSIVNTDYAKTIYTSIRDACNAYLKSKYYTGNVDNDMKTLLGNYNIDISKITDTNKVSGKTLVPLLLGKVILIMDTTLYPTYTGYCSDLSSIINMDNNLGESTATFSYGNLPSETPLTLSNDKYSCSVTKINQSLWIDNKNISYHSNSDSFEIFKKFSCQLVPMLFFNNGSDLYNYEMLFNNCGGGIVPLSLVYGKVNVNADPYISYPEPVFALPNYGNNTLSIIIITSCLGIAGFIIYREAY